MEPSRLPVAVALLERITTRIGRHLERRGLLVWDTESSHLSRPPCAT